MEMMLTFLNLLAYLAFPAAFTHNIAVGGGVMPCLVVADNVHQFQVFGSEDFLVVPVGRHITSANPLSAAAVATLFYLVHVLHGSQYAGDYTAGQLYSVVQVPSLEDDPILATPIWIDEVQIGILAFLPVPQSATFKQSILVAKSFAFI